MQILQLAKNLNSISFYVEKAALLFATFSLFTSFFWKDLQIFNKTGRHKREHTCM